MPALGCARAGVLPRYSVTVPRLTSQLNLNGRTPVRVQPKLGAWGPRKVPTTRWKKIQRWLVVVALVIGAVAVFAWSWYIIDQIITMFERATGQG